MGKKYDLNKDYTKQLRDLAFDDTLNKRFESRHIPRGKALVKLFFFDPDVPEDTETALHLPKGIIGTNGNPWDSKKMTEEAAKAQGPRAIVRLIKCGEIVGDVLTEEVISESPLFSVPDDDIIGTALNPDFEWQMQNMYKKNDKKGTTEVVSSVPERLPKWEVSWGRYLFSDQTSPTVHFEGLFLVPQSKLLMPFPVPEKE